MHPNPSSAIIPCIAGDGIGKEITAAMQMVIDQAVLHAYQNQRHIIWQAYPAGLSSFQASGEWLPEATMNALRTHPAAIKGPLTTPVAGGMRSLNVQLRQALDLYVCLRQMRWFESLPSPHHSPEGIDIVIFRENTEDIYTGIEYQPDSEAHRIWLECIRGALPDDYARIPHPQECGIGIKPISRPGSQRLMRAALRWALDNNRQRLTIVHKGNIMKFTEGAFRNWAYDVAENEFSSQVLTRHQYERMQAEVGDESASKEKEAAQNAGQLWIDDVIADVAFEQLITRPQGFDVIATTNLNGDYLSDAAAALTGGVGISPGANINFEQQRALFEANHGSAEALAGKNLANPSSLILSAEMMLRFIGWQEAANLVINGLKQTVRSRLVTFDLAQQIEGAKELGTMEFAQAICSQF